MISPTGLGIRIDPEGSGHLGASRGNRRHAGEDWLCVEGQDIVAPFTMIITRKAYPNSDLVMKGIAWIAGRTSGRMFYFIPTPILIGRKVTEGQVIGIAQSVSEYYNLPKMKDHIHFEVRK